MIRPLRRDHLWIWTVLAFLLPLLVASAIAARHVSPELPYRTLVNPADRGAQK